MRNNITSRKDFGWLECMRFYFTHPPSSGPIIPQGLLKVCMADAAFDYGFEYLGISFLHVLWLLLWLRSVVWQQCAH